MANAGSPALMQAARPRHRRAAREPPRRCRSSPPIDVCPAKERAATHGPFNVQVFARKHRFGGKTVYVVRVAGANGEHWLSRRFRDFVALRDSLGDRSQEIPVMPRKSFFRQRASPEFRQSRHVELRDMVSAAIQIDPLAVSPGVRLFLGLDAMTSEQTVSMEQLQQFLLLSPLSFRAIEESDGDSGSPCDEDACLNPVNTRLDIRCSRSNAPTQPCHMQETPPVSHHSMDARPDRRGSDGDQGSRHGPKIEANKVADSHLLFSGVESYIGELHLLVNRVWQGEPSHAAQVCDELRPPGLR